MAAILLAMVMPVATAEAQVGDRGRQLLQEKQEQEMRERAQKGPTGLDVKVAPGPGAGEAGEPCFPVKRISVKGARIIDRKEVETVVRRQHKPCMGKTQIESLIMEVNKLYIERGYITTRTYPIAQDLIASGVLQLEIVEGVIEKITYLEKPAGASGPEKAATAAQPLEPAGKPAPAAPPAGSTPPLGDPKPASAGGATANGAAQLEPKGTPGPRSKIATAFPTTPGDVLYLRDLEQGLDQINRVPSSKATIDIRPGEKPGGSELVVTNRRDEPWRVNAKYVYTGYDKAFEKRADITLEADDLLQANDTWYVAYSGTSIANNLSMIASVPYGYWLFSAQGSYSESMSQLTSTSDMFTRTASAQLSASWLMFRDAVQKLKLEGALAEKWNSRYINATELTPQLFPTVRAGISYERYLNGAFVAGGAGISRGLGSQLGPQSDAPGAPRADFTKLDATGTYYRRYDPGFTSYTTATVQWTPDVLYTSEQMYIGGSLSVRGFTMSQAPGDWGGYLQNTLNFPLPALAAALKSAGGPALGPLPDLVAPLSPYVFIDAGWVHDIANDRNKHLIGAGAGLTYGKDRLTTDLYVALPVLQAGTAKVTGPEVRLSVNVKLY